MSVCIFPGTFNPIHDGHIKMAEYVLEKYNFDKIIFIPSYLPPHKEIDKKLSGHRFNMVKLAISKNKRFDISDIEFCSETKSYSLITVKKIIEQYELTSPLNFIIGTDAFAKIDTWYKAEELKSLVHFIVFPRRGFELDKNLLLDWDYELTDMNYVDVSSTEIRSGNNDNIDKNVEVYIKKNGLY